MPDVAGGSIFMLVLQVMFSANPSDGVSILVFQVLFSANLSHGVSIPVLQEKILQTLHMVFSC